MCLETFAPISPGRKLDLEIHLPSLSIPAEGQVQWCREISRGVFRVGVFLTHCQIRHRTALRRYLHR